MRWSCADRDDDRDWRHTKDCSSQADGLGPATTVSEHDEYNPHRSTNVIQMQTQIRIHTNTLYRYKISLALIIAEHVGKNAHWSKHQIQPR